MALLKDILQLDNGAAFLNVDLHVHSFGASDDVRDPTMTPKAIVDAAVAQGLSVIAITDHNSDQNVQTALTCAKPYADKLLVVPGVEVTSANGHLLAYFAPDNTVGLNTFLAKLDLIGARGAQNTHTKKSMADVMAEAFGAGGICVAAHIDRVKTGFETLADGYPNWKRDILTNAGLYGVECDAITSLTWYSEADSEGAAEPDPDLKRILQARAAERRKLLRARAGVAELDGRRDLAHVQGSDAHTLADFQNLNPDKPWTRMKLTNLTFEAFRTAMIDPTARIRANAALPKAIPRVRGIAFGGGFLNGEVIHFSDNLNCFIGGRGTGKSTAIRSLAYCFGVNNAFCEFENCPDSVVVYCEDANGVCYRYERARGGGIAVTAKEDNTIKDVPTDIFRIEYFGQGELADVAKDPVNTPQLFQAFLDRHVNLRELIETENSLVHQLRENAARLNSLETSFYHLTVKTKSLTEVEKKLKIAEEGKLQEVVGVQSRIAAEKTAHAATEEVGEAYKNGLDLSVLKRDFAQLLVMAGEVTTDSVSKGLLQSIQETIDATNKALDAKANEINAHLKLQAVKLTTHCAGLKANHSRMEKEVAVKVTALKEKGLAGSIAELTQLIIQKQSLGKDIAATEKRRPELNACRAERVELRANLTEIRQRMTARRKAQFTNINQNLAQMISDYSVFVRYDPEGIVGEFLEFVLSKMQGSYLPELIARQVCNRVTPGALADWVLKRESQSIANAAAIDIKWADELVQRLCLWNVIFELQVLAKQPKPVITVHTKSSPPKAIPVIQLSDGQRHTILLTIAMLAESNVPLVIDQPEDELDNAFIFSSIVGTLRSIKERRQVILVTHNANIAVLGDSELLLPMHRKNDRGKAIERGSVDRKETKVLVEEILEGGPEAFCRRQKIYGH